MALFFFIYVTLSYSLAIAINKVSVIGTFCFYFIAQTYEWDNSKYQQNQESNCLKSIRIHIKQVFFNRFKKKNKKTTYRAILGSTAFLLDWLIFLNMIGTITDRVMPWFCHWLGIRWVQSVPPGLQVWWKTALCCFCHSFCHLTLLLVLKSVQ